ncbi:oxygen-insensitive NADPH nitroreductase [Shewanella intestini]|uniref:Oxygen-insensitive NADPH nitroreductase n=1 Tax=Shewanella intestini TaxID=2017544 RepID=A0ABS5I421_9GAMM|nr:MULTISPECIES: oxygen-insensitive NADPH nitroreductase [Shewanella]MBR9728444.1 oxygen-insensitive NADPH nitroreductase [Shewanella intestini]MRG36786.1 oxygen-insensitive NADPH nitroreductase [Shewanella sp. XMDDZSB0408]
MNPTIDTLLAHRSIRKFSSQHITPKTLDNILQCAISASSSSFIQCVSIIRVTNPETRQQIAALAGGQHYVASAAEFLVFCADYNRHQQIHPSAQLGYSEQTLIGAVDTGLMGQNALIAAESLGLGGVFIGGIRNDPEQLTQLLSLPEHVLPLFGLCLGYPDQQPETKPRLPQSILVHQETYQAVDKSELAQYDKQITDYYASRSTNSKQMTWSEQITTILSKESRPFMQQYLHKQGFSVK